jgi:repressor LexA
MDTIARRLQMALDIRNMKQSDLVETTGIGKSSISTYLSGKYEPKQRNIYKMAKALNINEAWLMGEDVPMERDEKSKPSNVEDFNDHYVAPIVGTIPAGYPALAFEDIEGYASIPYKDAENYFFLRVSGESMINAGIQSGDLVLIRKQSSAEYGQIVAARVNGDEATLKKYKPQGDTVLLLPENPDFEPILVRAKDFDDGYASIIGVAIEVRHTL